ncbi:MAG: glycosyltransferase family 2 protein [Gemmatimonadota bacterium]|nr:MAG: glycosyltransferase family 2 protein [Gemmatimonadota bacterium]
MTGFISIIICTRDRAHILSRALRSLARQTVHFEKYEVIVVDDGSRDDTSEECERLRSELPNMKYVPAGEHVGTGRAGNIGLKSARGEFLAFTDDDCIVKEDWVERMTAALHQEPIIAGTIASPTENRMKLCHNIDEFHLFSPGRKAGPVDFIAGANMGLRRSVLEELNGFRESGQMCEDMELVLRARQKGYRPYFVPDILVTHDPDRSAFLPVLKHAALRASETVHLRNQYRSLLKTPFVIRSPLLLLACAPLIALKVTAGIYLDNRRLARYFWTAPVVYVLKLAWCWGAARSLRTHKSKKAESQ